jgi:hypothetical protein
VRKLQRAIAEPHFKQDWRITKEHMSEHGWRNLVDTIFPQQRAPQSRELLTTTIAAMREVGTDEEKE